MALTYSKYLKVDELLNLQDAKSPKEHDEMLFIIIHQVYELWFKQVLHETKFLVTALDNGNTPQVLSTFKRILTILKVMVSQVDILETMTPLNFMSFRDRLESSSGFQSFQFRFFEFVLGKRSQRAIDAYKENPKQFNELTDLLNKPNLFDHFLNYLKKCGITVPIEGYSSHRQPNTGCDKIQSVLLEVYKSDPIISQVCERMVDLDEGIQEWRYRHVKMVERTIGAKMGTGGSPGVSYLKDTLFQPLFVDLWAIRSKF